MESTAEALGRFLVLVFSHCSAVGDPLERACAGWDNL